MTAHQQQLRRGTSAECASMTPAVAEPVTDTTNNRIRLGDGTTAGGIILPNAFDIQRQPFNTAVAGGTANAITLTLSPTPSGYTTRMKIGFFAVSTNTGASTINVNSLGARNIYKISDGTLSALAAGDLISGGYYEIAYDGTQFVLLSSGSTSTVSGFVTANTTSGTSVPLSGIHADANWIHMGWDSVSVGGEGGPLARIGTASGFETSAYAASVQEIGGSLVNFTTSFGGPTDSTTLTHSGNLTLTRVSGNTWTVSGTIRKSLGPALFSFAGIKTLSGPLTQVGLVTSSSTFNGGTISAAYG